MNFKLLKKNKNIFADQIVDACFQHGDKLYNNGDILNYVLNIIDMNNPTFYRRQSKFTFVISIITGYIPDEEIKRKMYNVLVRSLSNLVIYISPSLETWFITPEAGFYNLFFNPDEIYQKIKPVISSHFATDNELHYNLQPQYCCGTEITNEIKSYGKHLDEMGVLPLPFPLKEILTPSQLNHLYKIFGITGASYGNLSAREDIYPSSFWMTGRGVNKSDLKVIGKDIILVRDFDFANYTANLSVPPGTDEKCRVSVDAVEHAMIYTTFPSVRAIVHLHAWMDDIICTKQNYPCGTIELAEEVVALLNKTTDPFNAVVGLKNHGLTITGRSLKEIFQRIEGKLLTQVEMYA